MFVYSESFNNNVYSTAKKAVQSVTGTEYTKVYDKMDTDKNESVYIDLNDENFDKIVKILKEQGFITIYDNSENEYVTISQNKVR